MRVNDDPNAPFFDELKGAILIRELHVYGKLVPQDQQSLSLNCHQHRGIGKILLERAKMIAMQHQNLGFTKIAVISGVGVRKYYERNGYKLEGTYMTQPLASTVSPLLLSSISLTSKCVIVSLLVKYLLLIGHNM